MSQRFHIRADTAEQLRAEVVRWLEHREQWASAHATKAEGREGIFWDAAVNQYRNAITFWRCVDIESAAASDAFKAAGCPEGADLAEEIAVEGIRKCVPSRPAGRE